MGDGIQYSYKLATFSLFNRYVIVYLNNSIYPNPIEFNLSQRRAVGCKILGIWVSTQWHPCSNGGWLGSWSGDKEGICNGVGMEALAVEVRGWRYDEWGFLCALRESKSYRPLLPSRRDLCQARHFCHPPHSLRWSPQMQDPPSLLVGAALNPNRHRDIEFHSVRFISYTFINVFPFCTCLCLHLLLDPDTCIARLLEQTGKTWTKHGCHTIFLVPWVSSDAPLT